MVMYGPRGSVYNGRNLELKILIHTDERILNFYQLNDAVIFVLKCLKND